MTREGFALYAPRDSGLRPLSADPCSVQAPARGSAPTNPRYAPLRVASRFRIRTFNQTKNASTRLAFLVWRRGRDSNPRQSCPCTRVPGERTRPTMRPLPARPLHRILSSRAKPVLQECFWCQIGLSVPVHPHRTLGTAPGAPRRCTDFALKCKDRGLGHYISILQ